MVDTEDELRFLRRWKREGMEVMAGLQELGWELDLPLGEQITGQAALEAVRKLKARREDRKQRINEALHIIDTWLMEAENYDPDTRLIPSADLLRLRQDLAGSRCTCDEAAEDHMHCHHVGECCHCDCKTRRKPPQVCRDCGRPWVPVQRGQCLFCHSDIGSRDADD